MLYCASCGTQVDGRFCPKCGAAVDSPPGSAPTGSAPPPPSGSLGLDENIASALCYIPIIGLIFLLIEPYNKNKTIRFHALQSIFYCIAWIIVAIAMSVVFAILYTILPYGVWTLFHLIWRLVELAFVIGWIWMVVKAYQRERFEMPIVGPMAAKQA